MKKYEDQTPEEREMFAERRRARNRAKSKKKKQRNRANREALSFAVAEGKTGAVARRRLYPRAPEMTKGELRAMLAQAVRNTAGASA